MPDPEAQTFVSLTEVPRTQISRAGADMMVTRYLYASRLAKDKRVLELGGGAGIGLGLLQRSAAVVVGSDLGLDMLRMGKAHYGRRVPFAQLDAQALPFRDASFDLILFFEASYYVPDMDQALDEIVRVLAPSGTVVLVNANPQRPDFIPSPRSVHYHTADELRAALEGRGLTATLEGAFPVAADSGRDRWIALARRLATTFGLVPRSLEGRAFLKRLAYGPLLRVPPELTEEFGSEECRVPLAGGPVPRFRGLYLTASKS